MLLNIRKFKLSKLTCSIILATPIWISSAHGADETSLFSLSLEELLDVEVETRKTKESLGDVPLSNTLITQNQLSNNNIHSIYELAEFIPNFSYRPSFGRLQERGVTRGIANVTGENVTGIFIDGMSVTHLINTLDLTQFKYLEVIRGPQATLYGRSTFAGAVNLVTQSPLDNINNSFSLGLGNESRTQANLTAGYAFSEQFAVQFNGQVKSKAGEYKNTLGDGAGVLNQQGNASYTVGAAYKSKDELLNVKLTHISNTDDDSGYPVVLQKAERNNCFLDSQRQYYCGELKTPDSIGFNNSALNSIPLESGYNSESDLTIASVSSQISKEQLLSFKLARSTNSTSYLVDGDYSEVPFSWIGVETENDATEFELSANSSWSDTVSTLFGLMRYDSDSTSIIDSYFPVNNILSPTRVRNARSSVENTAAFGSITYKLNSDSDLIADLRWSKESITFANPISEGNKSFTSVSPKVTYRYSYDESTMIYASYSNGTKPGGFNPSIWNEALDDADQSLRDSYRAFEQESLWQTEFGIKGVTADNKLTYAANLYFGNWSDLQTAQSITFDLGNDNSRSESVISNEGSAKTRGFELEIKQQISTDLNGWANLGYAYTEFTNSSTSAQEQLTGDGNISGNQVPNSPELTTAIGANYSSQFNEWQLISVASLHHESKRFVAEHNLAEIPAINRLRLGVNATKGNWKLSVHSSIAENSSYNESAARLGDPSSFYRLRAFGLSLSDRNFTEFTVTYHF